MQQNAESRVRQLEDAFEAFTRMSSQLETSYRALEDKVARLNDELAAARSERLLQLAEKERIANRLERLLELLPGGVVVLDGEGIVTDCNPVAIELLRKPLHGQHWHTIIGREFVPGNDDSSEVTLNSGRRVNISTQSLEPEAGQIVLLMDVTDRHALQTMLNRHQRLSAMGEMAASLAHQVRTPLSSALLYLSNLRNSDVDEVSRERFTGKAIDRLRHLEGMVGDMLRFARGGSFDMEEIDLGAVISEWEQTLLPKIASRQGNINIKPAPGPVRLRGNRDALLGALLNLGSNAIEAAAGSPVLDLEIETTPDGQVVLRLSDNGCGITEDDREKVFTPFYTTKSDGTGLGLAIVKVIINAHQGSLAIEQSPGGGACFVMKLPLADCQNALLTSTTLTGCGEIPGYMKKMNEVG